MNAELLAKEIEDRILDLELELHDALENEDAGWISCIEDDIDALEYRLARVMTANRAPQYEGAWS